MTLPNKAVISGYGAPFVDAYPLSNPNTDQDASLANQCFADVADMTRTACRFWAVFTTAASTGALVLNSWDAVWGSNLSNLAPTLSRTSQGAFLVTVPSVITDDLGNTISVNFQRVNAQQQITASSLQPYLVIPSYSSANTCAVFVYTVGATTSLTDGPCIIHISAA